MSTHTSRRDWNDLSKIKPEIKLQRNHREQSDYCWLLFKDGSIKEGQYFLANGKGTFGFKDDLVTHGHIVTFHHHYL